MSSWPRTPLTNLGGRMWRLPTSSGATASGPTNTLGNGSAHLVPPRSLSSFYCGQPMLPFAEEPWAPTRLAHSLTARAHHISQAATDVVDRGLIWATPLPRKIPH